MLNRTKTSRAGATGPKSRKKLLYLIGFLILAALLVLVLLSGGGGAPSATPSFSPSATQVSASQGPQASENAPSGRVVFPEGGFSVVVPPAWDTLRASIRVDDQYIWEARLFENPATRPGFALTQVGVLYLEVREDLDREDIKMRASDVIRVRFNLDPQVATYTYSDTIIAGRPAQTVHVQHPADLEAKNKDLRRLDAFYLVKGGKLYVVFYVARSPLYSSDLATWEKFREDFVLLD